MKTDENSNQLLDLENNISKDENSNNPSIAIKLLSISQASKWMGIGRSTLLALINKGEIGTLSLGKRVRIPFVELTDFIKKQTVKKDETKPTPIMTDRDLDKFFGRKPKVSTAIKSADLLYNIMRGN